MAKEDRWTKSFAEMENRILAFWEENRSFEKLVKLLEDKPIWSFIDGPITANNPMGVHHAWGRTLKDIYQRYMAMRGFRQRFQNGYDCQGLWVEVEVEKDLNFKSKKEILDFGVENFCRACRDRVHKYSAVQTKQSKRLGQWMDWDHSYYTMDDSNIEGIWFFLKTCNERGWLYRGDTVLQWCARCGTALSHHEMADSYEDEVHPAVFVLCERKDVPREYFLVWTTTPWTLSSNTALAVNPNMKYIRVKQGDRTMILAETRQTSLVGEYEIVDFLQGKDLLGLRYKSLFPEFEVQKGVDHRVIPWKDVTADEGTGIVHIAPGCGKEDHQLSKEHGISVIVPINEDGIYLDGFGFLSGCDVTKVLEPIVKRLKQDGLLYRREDYAHRYPRCWRCRQELVFRLDDAWFISCEGIRERMIELGNQVEWYPDHIKHRFIDWLKNMQDWNISRKRFWGLPLPFYPCKSCGYLTVIGSRKELAEKATGSLDGLDELHRPWIDDVKIVCEKCGAVVERIPDVGDCWLDAGIVPFSTLNYFSDPDHWKAWYPAEFVCEMREQTRLWFYAQMFMSATLDGSTPYKRVLAYEKVHDEKDRPMHKSWGNAIWFDEAAEKMGVDVMRRLYAGQNVSENLRFGYGIADDARRHFITLWNVVTFYENYAEIDRPDLMRPVTEADLEPIDKWLRVRTALMVKRVRDGLDKYDTTLSIREFDSYIDDLSNWYVRECRDRFWAPGMDEKKRAAYAVLFDSIYTLIKTMAPFFPFITEEIHQRLIRPVLKDAPESIHHAAYPDLSVDFAGERLVAEMDKVRRIVTLGLNARNQAQIRVRQPLGRMLVYQEQNPINLTPHLAIIFGEMNVKSVDKLDDPSSIRTLSGKPNYKNAGVKLGKSVKAFAEYLKGADLDAIKKDFAAKSTSLLTLDGHTFTLEPGDILFETHSKEGWSVAEESGICVALDTTITESLMREGLARDLVRSIQSLRKDADLHILDRIDIVYATDDKELIKAVEEFRDHILRETLGDTIEKGDPVESTYSGDAGKIATIGISKVEGK